ncbi:MAG: hypothetical protein PSV22_01270 [Pseudolabrys sp.]|nr:hypothetical protein [Pseudolabrys sp.]
MMNSIAKMASMAVTGLDLAEHKSSLQWWREAQPYRLDESQAASLRSVLSRIAYLDSPDWRLAVAGDAARAVHIALRTAASHRRRHLAIDYAASALLLCAAGGDTAAAVTLAHLDRRFAILQHIARGEA